MTKSMWRRLRRRERKLCLANGTWDCGGGLKLAFGLEIDLPADAQDVDAIGVVPGGILDEGLGGFAGRG